MTDRETPFGPAAIAGLLGGGRYEPRFYGGGPAAHGGSDSLLLRLIINYLQDHPQERSGLANELRALPVASGATESWAGYNLYGSNWTGSNRQMPSLPEGPSVGHLADTTAVHHCDYSLLETHRSDVASLARFSQRVDHATWYLCVAIDNQAKRDVWPRPSASSRRKPKNWYSALARQCFGRWKTTRKVLSTDWSIVEASEPLYRTAFWSLCELTPADSQLKLLFEQDRLRACRELVRHVDAYAEQLSLAADLAEAMDDGSDDPERSEEDARRAAIQEALLARAGEGLTLTEAAERLGITRQGLYKKIKSGTALGLMVDDTFVVPSAQFVERGKGWAVVADLKDVLTLFSTSGAGGWSALQYLIEHDPALGGEVPLNLLKAGEAATVVAAARGYLGLDEG